MARSLEGHALDTTKLQEPENEASWANNVTVPKRAAAPLVKFARFENGKLILLEARTDSLEYLSFSHVWGDWTWRDIPGIPYRIKASQGKANFIENDLPAIVGQVAFWMDTLTVDQSNGKEVIDVVGAIPTIFRHAKRTIAIREPDGIYDCCVQAVHGFNDFHDFNDKLNDHARSHYQYIHKESYLQRLWTLQECLLSHTIEFVPLRDSML